MISDKKLKIFILKRKNTILIKKKRVKKGHSLVSSLLLWSLWT